MEPPGRIDSRAAWAGPELHPSEWTYELSELEVGECRALLEALGERAEGAELPEPAAFPLGPALRAAAAAWRSGLRRGRGFVLVRGLPVVDAPAAAAAGLYALLGSALGAPVPQNLQGERLCHVRDTGADPTSPGTRLYTTRAEQDFHTDGADLIGLLCLRTARSGGLSRVVSSVRVYNEVLARRPELAPLLFEPWPFLVHGGSDGVPAMTIERPLCQWDGEHLNTFFIGWYIRRALEAVPELPRLTPAQTELLELFEATANDPALYLEMEFRPGDMQWLKNSVILHKRTAYEDFAEPERRRHLLRLWLAAADFEDGDELLRQGLDARLLPEHARVHGASAKG